MLVEKSTSHRVTLTGEELGTIKPGGMNTNEHLTFFGRRDGSLLEREIGRRAWIV